MCRLVPWWLMLLGALAGCSPAGEGETTNAALVEDQYAYHVGVLAYLYGYPMVDRYRRDHNAALRSAEAGAVPELDPMRGLGFFEVLNLQLRQHPPGPGDGILMTQFDAIGVGPSSRFEQSALSPARKRGLERAIRDARAMLDAAVPPAQSGASDLLARAAGYRAEQSRAADSRAADSRAADSRAADSRTADSRAAINPETRTAADSR